MKNVSTTNAPAAIGPYSQGYVVGNLVFSSGQIPVITGFFGMNVPLPFMNEQRAWIMICAVSALLWVILTWVMRWIIRRR